MAYLRVIATRSMQQRNRRACLHCGRRVYRFERYCPYCGGTHGPFDEELFVRLAKTSLTEALAGCQSGVSHIAERIGRNELADQALQFCPVCGARLAS